MDEENGIEEIVSAEVVASQYFSRCYDRSLIGQHFTYITYQGKLQVLVQKTRRDIQTFLKQHRDYQRITPIYQVQDPIPSFPITKRQQRVMEKKFEQFEKSVQEIIIP